MPYPAQRSRYYPPRGLVVLLLIIGAIIAATVWIGPFRPVPAELRLVLASPIGQGKGELAILPNAGSQAEPRFPLVLALENRGGRIARPVSVSLSLPATFRVRSSRGPLERESEPGNPLVRYELPVPERQVAPGTGAEPIGAGDTLWLEPNLSDYYCTALSDSIPEFVPAPALPTEQLANLQVYYSFREHRFRGREGGLLGLRLDPAALVHRPAPMPPTYPTQVREPELPRPQLGALRQAGTRQAECGDPQQPLKLYTVDWETAGGGRFLVVYLNGTPRKQLFDLDRDSIIELEMWDPDADGRFEARRAARYAIPPFLLPERLPAALLLADSVLESPGWLALFEDTTRGPFRFAPDSLLPPEPQPPAGAGPAAAGRDTAAAAAPVAAAAETAPRATPDPADAARVAADSEFMRRFNDVGAGPFRFVPDAQLPPALRRQRVLVDSAWLRKFNDVEAGPFRFSDNPPPLRARPAPPPRPRGPVPLGTPLPNYPRPPRRGR